LAAALSVGTAAAADRAVHDLEAATVAAHAFPPLCAAFFSSWHAPASLGVNLGSSLTGPRVAVAANGDAVVVWLQDEGVFRIKANRFARHGGAWARTWQATPETLASFSYTASPGVSVPEPRVAMDAAGNAVVAWVEYQGSFQDPGNETYSVHAARATPGSGWGPAARLGTSDLWYPPVFDVAAGGEGTAIVVWERLDAIPGIRNSIYYSRFDGARWSGAATLENSAGSAGWPRVGMDAKGRAAATWVQEDVEHSVYSRRYVAPSWGPITRIDSAFDQRAAWYPEVSVSATGEAAVSWIADYSSGGSAASNVWSNVMRANGAWGSARALALKVAGSPRHAVAGDDSGNAAILWEQTAAGSVDIRARRLQPGGALDAAVPTLDNRPDGAGGPAIDMGATGDASAVWRQSDGVSLSVFASRLTHRLPSPGCPEQWTWSAAAQIDQSAALVFSHPHVALYPNGDAVATWIVLNADGSETVKAAAYY
jgi:hypothetical protein